MEANVGDEWEGGEVWFGVGDSDQSMPIIVRNDKQAGIWRGERLKEVRALDMVNRCLWAVRRRIVRGRILTLRIVRSRVKI